MDELSVNNTSEYLPCPASDGSSIQRSEQVAASPCSTKLASEFSNNFKQTHEQAMVEVPAEALASLILLAVQQRGQMLSPDARYLALLAAKGKAGKMGISESVFLEVAQALESHGGRISNANPMSGMF
jgi:hypothetical protein